MFTGSHLNYINWVIAQIKRELKPSLSHTMPPHSLRGSTGLTSIGIFCRILLLACPWYSFAQNVIGLSVGGCDYLLQFSSKSVQYLYEVKENVAVVTGHTSGQRDVVKKQLPPRTAWRKHNYDKSN